MFHNTLKKIENINHCSPDLSITDAWIKRWVIKTIQRKESLEKIENNTLRILDSNNPEDKEVINNAPGIDEYINKDSQDNFQRLLRLLEYSKIDYEIKTVQKEAVWKNIITEDSKWAYPRELDYMKKMRNLYKALQAIAPLLPNSSAITAKIKSL